MPPLVTPTHRSSGWFKYMPTNLTSDTSDIIASAIDETVPDRLRLIPFRGWRSLSVQPFGGNATNEDFLLMIMLVYQTHTFKSHVPGYGNFNTNHDPQWTWELYKTLKCTLNATADGTAGAWIDATDFLCDTITVTNSAYCTAIESVTGFSGVAYSPTGDVTPATYFCPDLFNPDFVYLGFDLDGGDTTANDVNCLVKLDV